MVLFAASIHQSIARLNLIYLFIVYLTTLSSEYTASNDTTINKQRKAQGVTGSGPELVWDPIPKLL
jgi:hypothetical protein